MLNAQRLEGSRFVSQQLYRFAAGGSRELPSLAASIQRIAKIVAHEDRRTSGTMANLGRLPGAACCKLIELPSCKAAPLQALGVYRYSRLFVSIRGCFGWLSARFDKPRCLVLVAGSARAKLSTVGPWVLSSNVGSRTRQG